MFHEHAVGEHQKVVVPDDHLPPPRETKISNRKADADGDKGSQIGYFIPRGKAVALPSIQISEEEDKGIDRGQYGGKGDKAHLGGFTEFDVREEQSV